MFAVNGPSGPTSRIERRCKSDRQQEEEEETKRRWTERKRKDFFLDKHKQGDSFKKAAKAEVKKIAAVPDIFKGCHIVFNGRTGNVSAYYLAKLVHEYGGNVVSSTLTPTRVTHMVGLNLNGSKANKVLTSTSKVKFVRPEWILQSVKREKRQSESAFLVYKNPHATTSLRAAFQKATSI